MCVFTFHVNPYSSKSFNFCLFSYVPILFLQYKEIQCIFFLQCVYFVKFVFILSHLYALHLELCLCVCVFMIWKNSTHGPTLKIAPNKEQYICKQSTKHMSRIYAIFVICLATASSFRSPFFYQIHFQPNQKKNKNKTDLLDFLQWMSWCTFVLVSRGKQMSIMLLSTATAE